MSLFRKKRKSYEIEPDEIFLDSSNLPRFDKHQLEGRLETSITKKSLLFLGMFFILILSIFVFRVFFLQVVEKGFFRDIADNNRLRHIPILAERGVIIDRNGNELAWNEPFKDGESEFSKRYYLNKDGLAHVLGYIKYPAKDKYGFYYQEESEGKSGVELSYDNVLRGNNGLKIIEIDALNFVQSESILDSPRNGESIILSIDARIQEKFYQFIQERVRDAGFHGGAGVIMDVRSGEILSLVSFPEYDSEVLSSGADKDRIDAYISNDNKPFLNRVISGLYSPGSIIKPFLALAALNEGVITPDKKILSTGSISIPHPYIPNEESIFKDWKAHGWVDLKDAIAFSSNVYFFEIGGGYKDQEGLGIKKIERYMKIFGFGEESGIDLAGKEIGTIPTPKWKKENFNDEWRVGDTYNTSIGQYGFQVTPLQAVQGVAAIANNGKILRPHVVIAFKDDNGIERSSKNAKEYIKREINISDEYFSIVRDGMRKAVTNGTALGLNIPAVKIAAKTGTAEIGFTKAFVNSWIIGFFPYENPKYAFSVVMERGPRENLVGALFVMRQLFEWMALEVPEYLESD